MLRSLAGLISTAALRLLGTLPPGVIVALGSPLLPFYALIRPQTKRRLRSLPVPVPTLPYYRMRLRLAALSLRHLTNHPNDLTVRIEGEEHYHAALASGKPVALLGWHQGPVELLHRIPPASNDDRPFYILTAEAFSLALTGLLKQGRTQPGKTMVDSDRSAALRDFIRRNGLLAVMVDQVPGDPSDFFSLWNGSVKIPRTGELLEWLRNQGSLLVAVTVSLEKEDTVLFRYHPVNGLEDLEALLEKSLAENPLQYNWSYPKIRLTPA